MKLQAKYSMAFMTTTLITLIAVGLSLWGFNTLKITTDHLFDDDAKILEYGNYFEKELAHSRRSEKEFFIFPNNSKKQRKYMKSWKGSYKKLGGYLNVLDDLYKRVGNKTMLTKVSKAREILSANDKEFDAYTKKFMRTKSYSSVNKAEYGFFKKRTHELEAIGVTMGAFGQEMVRNGSRELSETREKTELALKVTAIFALLWGLIFPLFFARKFARTITSLAEIGNQVSQGRIDVEIKVDRHDELGELAISMKRMKKSVGILMDRLANR